MSHPNEPWRDQAHDSETRRARRPHVTEDMIRLHPPAGTVPVGGRPLSTAESLPENLGVQRVDHSGLKLGKRPARSDPRTFKLAKYLDVSALPEIPPSRSWDKGIQSWGMMGNDRYGDCTCAAIGHAVQVWTANADKEVTLSDQDVLGAYSAITGFNPNDPNTDQGAVEIDVLNYWHRTGVAGHVVGAFAAVQPHEVAYVEAAIDLFGVLYIGILLPISAQTQLVWDVPPGGTQGNGAPGSWGGHAVVVIDYDANGLICITWGGLKRMTWPFFSAYCDEAYALLSQEWVDGSKPAPSGFDLPALQNDLALVSGQTPPVPQGDPQITSFLNWQETVAVYLQHQYPENLAETQRWMDLLSQQVPPWASYISGRSASAPRLPDPPNGPQAL